MGELLEDGRAVRAIQSGKACKVTKFLGGGGQGEVYLAEWGGRPFALKWYFAGSATPQQRECLENLTRAKPPTDDFLWPLDLTEAPGIPGFGYIMRLREPGYKGILDLMMNRVSPPFRTLATVGLGLADNYFKLHSDGYCYRDISFGNAFFDPKTGKVLICDNDNVMPRNAKWTGVLGTPDFMAPEIVRQEMLPDVQTDLHSLAVLLFYIFYVAHPLYGRKILGIHCFDMAARTKLCGTEPVFIFDPRDKSNEAVDRQRDPTGEAGGNAIIYWQLYPPFLNETFVRAFTDGLRDRDKRVRENEWRKTFSALRDCVFYCPACGSENFYAAESGVTSAPPPKACWHCHRELVLPFRIQIGKSVVMCTHDAKLYAHHISDSATDYDFSHAVGEVVQHPKDPRVWGLKNCTTDKWVATMADGSMKDIEPGRSVVLAKGTNINFGKVVGEIAY